MAQVFCWSCKRNYHETTDMYDEELPLTGDMLRAKDIVRKNKWATFPEKPTTRSGSIECPNCGSLYLHRGELLLDVEPEKKPRKIPDDYNGIIMQMTKEGKTPTDIAEQFNFTKQAVGRRIYDIRKKADNG